MKILVLTDFSDIAEAGLKTAVRLGEQLGNTEIMLLNFIIPVGTSNFSATGDTSGSTFTDSDRFMIELIEKNKQQLRNESDRFESANVKIQPFIEVGDLQKIVDAFVHARNVDMIVMGTSGHETFEEYFVGNHTEQVLRLSDIPVISVKTTDHTEPVRNLVVAVDMNDKATKGLIKIKQLADRLNAEIHLVHVTKKDDVGELREQLETYAREHGLQNYSVNIVNNSDTEDGIKQFTARVGGDMIALVTHGHEGLRAMLSHSVSEDIIKEASVPVLAVNMHHVH